MLRPFPFALDLGAYHGLLGRKVAELPSVGAMIYAESALAFAALCPRPALVCDEDLLPFKDASLNLIVSGLALHRVNDLPGALIQIRRALAPGRLVHGGAARRPRARELREALIEAEAETRRGKPARRPVRRCARIRGAAAARRLRAAGGRCRDLDRALCAQRELMREMRALGGGNVLLARSRGPLVAPDAAARRSDLSRAPRHAGRAGERHVSRSSI